jgi:hypothetical protein
MSTPTPAPTIDYCPQCCRPVPLDEAYCFACGYCLGCDFEYPRRQEAATPAARAGDTVTTRPAPLNEV